MVATALDKRSRKYSEGHRVLCRTSSLLAGRMIELNSPSGNPMPIPASNFQGSRRWIALALLCAAQFMVMLDFSIVNVALPSMQPDLGML